MNAIANIVVGYIRRKYTERSTWVGIVVGLAAAAHYTLSSDAANALADVAVSIVGAAFVLYNERKGAAAAPTADAGGVRDTSAPSAGGEPAPISHVPAVPRADLPPEKRGNDADVPRPVRPGINRT